MRRAIEFLALLALAWSLNAQTPQAGGKGAGSAEPAKLAEPKKSPGAGRNMAMPVDEKTYIIGPEDVVSVQVWNQPNLTGQYLVRPDGRISIPFVREVSVAGRTPLEVGQDITERLTEFIKDPQVVVSLAAIHSKKYFIQGEVLKPGPNDLIVPTTVMEGLVNAGGFKDFADQKNIRILRDGGRKILKFNYKEVLSGKNLQQNVLLEPGDIIIVK